MPGFRPGKVPANLIRKMHGPALHSDAFQASVRESIDTLMKEKKLRPALQPKVDLEQGYEEGKDAELNYRLGTQLPYLFVVNRLAHYIKVLQREQIGSWKEKEDLERELNTWIAQYVVDMDNPSPTVRSRCPLRAAEIKVRAWDRAEVKISGTLGDGTINPSTTPVTVSGVTDAIAISTGHDHACTLHQDHAIRCWGSTGRQPEPGIPLTQVSAGSYYSCAVNIDGLAVCWGDGFSGRTTPPN